jgi:ribosome-binding factor A
MTKRTERLNSLLKQVIAEVLRKDVDNPKLSGLITVTSVDISPDLHHAKVFVSVMASAKEQTEILQLLQSAAGFIGINASKKIVLRYFPSLLFKLDSSIEHQMRIHTLLEQIQNEQNSRPPLPPTAD